MSHRKVHSQGSIPFSWETVPGVCKLDIPFTDSPKPNNPNDQGPVTLRKIPIPPPPCKNGPDLRHVSLRRQLDNDDDPFLVAFKECTRITAPISANQKKKKKVVKYNSKFGFRSSMSIFSCNSSCDIREDNFVKLSHLPPLPKGRSRSTIVQ